VSDIDFFEIASQKAQWLSARRIAVVGNVANANSPGYHTLDVQPFSTVPDASRIALACT
jgi:flagellar basal-body rod protein FlgB